jgi:hypothetical protein
MLLALRDELYALVPERTISTELPPLVGEVSAIFADRGCLVVSVTDSHGRILGFLDRSLYYFFQVAPQLYSTRLNSRSRPTTSQKIWYLLESNPGPIDLYPELDHISDLNIYPVTGLGDL